MIPDVKTKEEEVKKIWLEKRGEMKTGEIYKTFLGDYFDVANWSINNKDWLFFLSWIRDWQKVIKKRGAGKQSGRSSQRFDG